MSACLKTRKKAACFIALVAFSGCPGPEDGRRRGGGDGGDGGNYVPNAIHVPSKLDGTKSWPTPRS